MLKNTITVALRSLRRYVGTTALNAVGLTVDLAACVLIATFVRHERRVDGFQSNADRLVPDGGSEPS